MRISSTRQRAGDLLLIEDTPSLQMLYSTILRKAGFHTYCAGNAREGLDLFREHKPKVVLLDLMLPDRDGLDLIGDLLIEQPEARIIVITANGSVSKAVEATRAGACDFIVKPLGDVRLISAVANAFAESRRQSDSQKSFSTAIIDRIFTGQSPAITDTRRIVNSIAKSTAPVFITGESGTGKENCARALHLKSSRAGQRFIAVNCAAITAEQLDAEILGRTAPDSTDIASETTGAANETLPAIRGTLFLDNVTEMPHEVQIRLLHLLQTSTLNPVGTRHQLQINARIISASTRNPEDEVRARRLREDLYYRLYVVPVQMPPLRHRSADLPQIVAGIVTQLSAEEGKNFKGIDSEVLELFSELPWPGNLRQLVNVLRNAIVLHNGEMITTEMLPVELMSSSAPIVVNNLPGSDLNGSMTETSRSGTKNGTEIDLLRGMTMSDIEKLAIERAIERHGGSVPRAARELDLAPSTIYRKREGWSGRNA